MFTSQPSVFGRGTLCVARYRGSSRILLVALNRPQVRNAINDEMYEDLIDIMNRVATDASLACMVLTGTGTFFSSGADLKAGQLLEYHQENNNNTNNKKATAQHKQRDTLNLPAGRFMMALLSFPKLFCAAVNGPTVGIGVTLLLHCDLVHCSPSATFWAPFTRLALVPELCSSVTFVETMGLSKANELLLLGKKINAQTAYDWNLCSKIVDEGSDCKDPFDPFDASSLASKLCLEVEQSLLSLPLGQETSSYFVSMIRQRTGRRQQLETVCREELIKLDERFNTGQVRIAAQQLNIGKKRSSKITRKIQLMVPRSKL